MKHPLPEQLDVLEDLRGRQHQAARQRFLECQARVARLAGRVDEIECDFARCAEAMRQSLLGGSPPASRSDWAGRARAFQAALAATRQELARADGELEQARQAMLDARRQHQAVQLTRRRRVQAGESLRRLRATAESDDLHASRLAQEGGRR